MVALTNARSTLRLEERVMVSAISSNSRYSMSHWNNHHVLAMVFAMYSLLANYKGVRYIFHDHSNFLNMVIVSA